MSDRPPNILLVVADCGRSDRWLGPGRTTRTPHIDRLCREGISFPTTITEKSCTTPSFATLLSGLYSPRHGVHLVWGYRLSEQIPLLTNVLAKAGYTCYAEVTGPLVPDTGLARGFERYEYRAPCDYLHTAWGDLFLDRLRTGHYREPWFLMLHLWELHPRRQIDPACSTGEFGTNDYEQAVSSLDIQLGRVFGAANDRTLIIFTGDHGQKLEAESYRPGTAVDYARRLLKIDEADGMETFNLARWAGPSVLQQFYGHCVPMMQKLRLKDEREKPVFGRWARLCDRLRLLRLTPHLRLRDLFNLASPLKLTAVLRNRGLLDEQRSRAKVDRLVRSVDQKTLLGMHMRMWTNSYKNNIREGHLIHVYDFLVRVPLVISGLAGLPVGRSFQRMIRQPDILPTILDLLGFGQDALGDIDGRSVRPLIEGRPWEPLPAYLSVTGLPADLELHGVRTERYKYTYGPNNPELPEELYDLESDPGETDNLASGRPGLCEELRRLAASLLPTDGTAPVEMVSVTPEQEKHIEKHLQELGYIE